jgi:hypothetical protein
MGKKNRRARRQTELRRRVGTQAPGQSVLVVCEGGKTEPQYFKALAGHLGLLNLVEVQVEGKECGSAPISVVDHAIKVRAGRKQKAAKSNLVVEFDEVWCVCDVEVTVPHPTLPQARDKATGNDISIVLSNPCFEYWYILHFEYTTRGFSRNEQCKKRLKKHLPEYEKGSTSTFESIKENTDIAVKRAEKGLQSKQCNMDPVQGNSSTDVYKLIRYLKGFSS